MLKNDQKPRWSGSFRLSPLVAIGILVFSAVLISAQPVHATTFTSTQSGSWGNPATWGGAGVPSCGDDAIIANPHTVTLASNTGGLGCNLNITINSGGTLDLGGFELDYSGNNTTFTNNGTFANSGAFNRLHMRNGGAHYTFAGNGTYSGNLKLEVTGSIWHIAPNTTFAFNGAANNNNIQINSGILDVSNPLVITAPSVGSNYVTLDQQGGDTSGTSLIQTQGNVRLRQTGGANMHVPVQTVSGVSQGNGYFAKGWTVDTGASLTLSGNATVSNIEGGSGMLIASGASLDLAGNTLNIAWNGPFHSNGTVNNSGAFNRIVFMDNGTHSISGTGIYSGNAGLEVLNNVTTITAGSALTFGAPAGNINIQVDSGATLNFSGSGSLTLSGSVVNNGSINFNSGSNGCGAAIRIRSSVNGTQRAWNGNSTSMTGVDARDQAGSAAITVNSGLNAGNNGVNWNFASLCIRSRADFDGDGRTDLSIFRPSNGQWWIYRSGLGVTVPTWGISTDVVVPGDYDGDGKTDLGVFRADPNPANTDYFVLNISNFTVSGVSWGTTGDIPVSGDYDGDGKTDFAVFRPSTNVWYILNSNGFTNTIEPFGVSGDIPMAMDPEADGRSNIAVFRPSNGTWYIARPTGPPAQNFYTIPFGLATDMPVPADYDGDNRDDVAVFRPSTGTWYVLRSSNGAVDSIPFGASGDIPVPGDYDGDARDDVAVFRGGTWYVNRSTAGFFAAGFGLATDVPIPKKYIP